MAINSGVFNTTLNPAEMNSRSFAATIARLFPNGTAPLLGLSGMIGKSRAKSSTHGYFSKTMTFMSSILGAGVLIGATTIALPSTVGHAKDQLFFNTRTREIVLVTNVVNGTDITVTRGYGRVAAAAMNIGDKLIHIGTAFQEGSNRPVARAMTTVYVPNYTQIFRDAWALTDTARASYTESGQYDNVTENRRDCGLIHSAALETAIIWGQPKMDTSGTQPRHTTQGIIDAMEQYAPGNTNVAGATTTFDQLVSLLEPAFQYSSDMGNPTERMCFGDAQAIRVLHAIGVKSGVVQIEQSQTSFGMQFQSFKFYKGTIHMKEHPLLNGLGMQGMALIVEPMALKLAYMDGRDTKDESYGLDGKIVENGTDGVGGSLTTECAVELINPFGCALIEGLTAAA